MTAERRSLAADGVATLAVAAFSLTACAGFARVFSGWDFLTDMAIIVAAGHGASLVCRRLRWRAAVAVPVTLLAVGWVIVALDYGETLWFVFPTSETWDLFRLELAAVREQFPIAVAPVVYGAGWDVLAAIGAGLAVVLADLFAFRAYARAETLVPGGVLFVFVGALGDDRLRVSLTVALVGVGVVTTVVLRAYHGSERRRTPTLGVLRRAWPATVAAALVIAIGAGFVGPRLPGADAAPIYDTRGGYGSTAEVASPLVDIRSRLTNRSNEELFRVRAEVESYWRVATLAEFDGTRWGMPEQSLEPAGSRIGVPDDAGVRNRQRITIADLGGELVPAAPEPYQASGPSGLRWVAETSTLVVVDGELRSGDVIEIMSSTPELDDDMLRDLTADAPLDAIYTELPDDLPQIVTDLARRQTAGAGSAYEAARMLQGWFHREFDYSLEVQPGHGNTAIESFLHERVGYCEQFAGTFAAMMRSLGYPARVAVGYTSGLQLPDGSYSVRGRNAHAWPEVWMDDVGWVAFEPTPGRGAPNAEAYTGLTPQQDVTPPSDDAPDDDDGGPAGPTTTVPLSRDDQGPNLPEELADPTGTATRPPDEPDAGTDPRPFVVGAVLLAGLALPAVVRRVRAGRGHGSPDAQLARMWADSVAAVARAGVPVRASDTPRETASRTERMLPLVARPFNQLADAVTEATYAASGTAGFEDVGTFGSSPLRRCHTWARQIGRAVDESSTTLDRVRRYFTVWS